MLKKMRKLKFINLFKNLYSLMKYDIHKDINELNKQIKKMKDELYEFDIEKKILIDKIKLYYDERPALRNEFELELSYLNENPCGYTFPYKQLKSIEFIDSGFDESKQLPYVVHDEKRLYFPSSITIEKAVSIYRNFIEKENILGGGYKEKSPHQYETDTFYLKEGDVLFDVGCAEALFALHHIEKVKKVYLIESDIYWIESLIATFEPYKEKVILINKLVSNKDSETTISLSTILKNEFTSSVFIKMDIEGHEVSVLNDSIETLKRISDISIACCTYHNQSDADDLALFFNTFGFTTEFSDGYMIFTTFTEIKPPYFRKGIIKARKLK